MAVQAGVQHGQDGRQQQEPDSEAQVEAEQSQFQPSVRSVLVALGVFAGLKASDATSTVVVLRTTPVNVTAVSS